MLFTCNGSLGAGGSPVTGRHWVVWGGGRSSADRSKQSVAVARDEPIGEIGERPDQRRLEDRVQDAPAAQARHQRQEGVQPAADRAVALDEKYRTPDGG